jgi:hypothetical protein
MIGFCRRHWPLVSWLSIMALAILEAALWH